MASAAILVWLQDRANAEKQRGQFDAYEIVVAFGESGTEGFTCDTIGELKARPPSKRSVSCAFMCRHRMFARIKPESAFVRPTLSWARWSYIRRYPPEPFLQARRGDCRPPHPRCIPSVAAIAKPAQALTNSGESHLQNRYVVCSLAPVRCGRLRTTTSPPRLYAPLRSKRPYVRHRQASSRR